MKPTKILSYAAALTLPVLLLFFACSKNPVTPPPVHDTTTVVKHDTLVVPPPPDPTVNLKTGLLVYLPFSGNIADSSGNANPTSAVGSVLTADAHGYANNAFGGTGAGERVYVTNNGSITFDTAYSISFGLMVNSNGQQAYVSYVNTATGTGPTFLMGTTYLGVNSFDWGAEDISLGCAAFGGNDNVNIVDTANFLPTPGSWYNVIGIYHKGTVQVYVNGKLTSTKVGTGTKANLCPTAKLVIGGWWDAQPLSLNGKMDNFRLYNRVLTPHEIVALSSSYQVTSNSVQPGLKTH